MNQYFRARDKPTTVRQVIKHSPFELKVTRIRAKLERQAARQLRRLKRRAPVVVRTGRKALAVLPDSVADPVKGAVRGLR